MGIITSLYNTTINIYRITATPSTTMYEVGAEDYALLSSGVLARICSGSINEPVAEGGVKESGAGSGYKRKLFVPIGTNIRSGDKIVETTSGIESTTEIYYINDVNPRPGGLTNHHIECIVTSSDFAIA